ncbi:efflux RND transporter periplasmic adaptor subunit [Desulfogranum japonicum]|uniref:efflux RND transporter periplasmic adaptor subunit n=1 Tax=Desulfogranum japonicum TaxID=231447 RepID=UPI000420FDA5|nr:efflux RND transporter periplasmic adaptor subunit [Desulfogranum japonicum]
MKVPCKYLPFANLLRTAFVLCILFFPLFLSACKQKNDANKDISLYGNVDIREVQMAFQDGGRIARINVEEGSHVKQGDLLAELDPTRYALAVRQLEAEHAAQEQNVLRLRQGSRPQEIRMAQAAVEAARADLRFAESELARKRTLIKTVRISEQEVENAQTKAESARAALQEAEQQLSLAKEGPRKEDIAQAEAGLRALNASLELAKQKLQDTRLVAPDDGIIRNRILQPGAMATAGSPVLTLALSNPLWVRAYISEPDLGKIQQGQEARIHSDSFPDKVYTGWVGFISPTAEFTPKTVETTELRTKLVYRTRIFACNDNQELRLGMPVTVTLGNSVVTDPQSFCSGHQ